MNELIKGRIFILISFQDSMNPMNPINTASKQHLVYNSSINTPKSHPTIRQYNEVNRTHILHHSTSSLLLYGKFNMSYLHTYLRSRRTLLFVIDSVIFNNSIIQSYSILH